MLSNTNLEELSLNHNQLSNLSKGSEFLPLSIKRLFLKGNQLEGMLTPRLLVPLEDLEEIDLS